MNRLQDLYQIGREPEELQAALIQLRQEYDAHQHDGTSSRAFETLQVNTISAQTMLIRKTSYSNTAAGIWMGIVDNVMKLKLGSASSYLQWDGSALSISGSITATSGTIGGFTIGATSLSASGITISTTAGITLSQGGSFNITWDTSGISFLVSTTVNANIRLFSNDQLRIAAGAVASNDAGVDMTKTGSDAGHLSPISGDTIDLGTSSNYFNEINYKTLTDRGCLGWFDEGVELQDGRKVTDIEAIMSVKREASKQTIYGVPMLDYSSMPKAVFKPAPIAKDDVYEGGKLRWKKGEKMGNDGAETTALISIMFGAIKELASRIEKLESAKTP